MELEELGYHEELENYRNSNDLDQFEAGRIIAEHKERYIVRTEEGDHEAVEAGEIDPKSYENYLKMDREKAFYESSAAERRRKDKQFGKMVKRIKKDRDIKGY